MKKSAFCTALLAAAMSMSVYAQQSEQTQHGQNLPRPNLQPLKMTEEQMKTMDERFVMAAYSGNKLEVRMSEYARDQVSDPQVKEIAEMMIKDHNAANERLESVAKKMNIDLPDDLLPKHKAMLQDANDVKGDMFRSVYLINLATLHVHDILEYSHVNKTTQNADLKAYTSEVLPIIKQHYQQARPIIESEAGVEGGLTMKD